MGGGPQKGKHMRCGSAVEKMVNMGRVRKRALVWRITDQQGGEKCRVVNPRDSGRN